MDGFEFAPTTRFGLTYPFGEVTPGLAETIPVAPGIEWVRMPLPFSLKFINLWLVDDGDGWTIVDTGLPLPETKSVKLKLIDGTSDEPDPENPANFFKLNFKTYFMNLNLAQTKDKNKIEKKPKDMTIRELREDIARLKKGKIDPNPLIVEINERLNLAFSALVFVLVGAPLAMIARRREKSINIGIAVLIMVSYYPLFIGCEALGIEAQFFPQLVMWLPNIVFGAIGAIMTYKICAS